MTATARRIPALDGLRGVAVVAVVAFHAGHLRGGFGGVDLFFVLSGFLITGILRRSWSSTRSLDLRTFWARRARRLLPALLAMLAVVVPVWAAWFSTSAERAVLRGDALATLAYVANWYQIAEGRSYWATTLAESPLEHTWSLSVEEQLYLVWPVALLALLRWRGPSLVKRVVPAVAVVLAGATALAAATGAVSIDVLYLATPSRAAALLAGAALAVWWTPPERGHDPRLEVAALGALAVLVVMWCTLDVVDERFYTVGLAVSAVCGTILVAAAAHPRPGPIVGLLAVAPLRWLGTISYGVYLWSWPITQMVSERRTDLDGAPLLGVQLALTLGAATASWYLLERPILTGAMPWPRSGQLLGAATVAVVVLVLASTSDATSVEPNPNPAEGYRLEDPAATRLVVVGDSVPGLLVEEGIAPLGAELGVAVANRTVPGCMVLGADPVRGREGRLRDDVGPCGTGWDAMVEDLRPDVVLAMFGALAYDEVELDGTFRRPCDPAYQEALAAELNRGLDRLTSTGATVVLVTAPGSTVSWVVEADPLVNERMACLNDAYVRIADARDDVALVDLAATICPAPDRCLEEIDGIDLRADTVHFRDAGARLVARLLVPEVVVAAGS